MHEYVSYPAGAVPAGSLVVKLYRSGNKIRGYVRKVADIYQDDTLFPARKWN